MKILNFWTVALMALSFSTTFVSCGDDNDINLAKEIAGTYNGYSVGECDMFRLFVGRSIQRNNNR